MEELLRHIQAYQKPSIFAILEYSEPFHNCILTHIQTKIGKPCVTLESEPWNIDNPGTCRTLTYLKPDIYTEHSKRFKMECFAKIAKSYH